MAVSAIFAASVGISLVLGSVLLSSTTHTIVDSHQREWSFVLPTALVLMLMGLKSQLSLARALILVAESVVVLMLWTDPRRMRPVSTSVELHPHRTPQVWANIAQGCWRLHMRESGVCWLSPAAGKVWRRWRLPGNGFISAVLIGPAMMLPLVGTGTQLANEHRQGEVLSTLVSLVLINVLVILPAAIITAWFDHLAAWQRLQPASTDPIVVRLLNRPVLPFPHAAWRVDTMMILILAMFLVPLSLNRWLPSRLEGFALIFAYVCYLLMSAYAAMAG